MVYSLLNKYYMRTYQFPNKDKVAAQLAESVNTSPEELVITRNATESLDLIITLVRNPPRKSH